MPRPPRHTQPGNLHEAVLKGFQARHFFVPEDRLNKLIIGALAYGQEKYGMKICYPVALSNHMHLLYIPDSHEQARDFFRLTNSQISHEVGLRIDWDGGIFKERYSSTVVTEEPEAEIARLKYLMSNGVKEGLVKQPESWPGVNGAKVLLSGTMQLKGIWIDRTRYDAALRKYMRELETWKKHRGTGKVKKPKRKPSIGDFEVEKILELTPIPCWQGLGREELRENVRQLREEILVEYSEVRATVRKDWKKAIRDKSRRCYRPARTKKGKRPKFHAATEDQWVLYVKNWERWLTRYEDASRKLRRGIVEALYEFPHDCFLPTGLIPSAALQRFAKPPPIDLTDSPRFTNQV